MQPELNPGAYAFTTTSSSHSSTARGRSTYWSRCSATLCATDARIRRTQKKRARFRARERRGWRRRTGTRQLTSPRRSRTTRRSSFARHPSCA
nr:MULTISPECIES: hypothetical protein [Burkholderia]